MDSPITKQHYINFQTVIAGLRLRSESTSPSLASISWIIDNAPDSVFINNLCTFLYKTLHHVSFPEQLLVRILNCIDFQSIISSKITKSSCFQYLQGSDITTIRNTVTSFKDRLPTVSSSFEVAIDAAADLARVFCSEHENSYEIRSMRISHIERLLSVHELSDLYFENSTISFLIYAPPHSGKTTLLKRIHEYLPIRDTDNLRELDFYTQVHITNMPHLLAQAISAIAILPSSGEFKHRCLKRSLPYQHQWYRDATNFINVAKARAPDRVIVVRTDNYVIDALMTSDLRLPIDPTFTHFYDKLRKALTDSSSYKQPPIFEVPGVFQ